MSLGYAQRLTRREDFGGRLGDEEILEAREDLFKKSELLARWWSEAKRVTVFTGAGISTACGIPDFRGPNGIWTKQKRGEAIPNDVKGFAHVKPSLTHVAISELVSKDKVGYVVSQNVDGIHLRTGIPRDRIAELHGNCFSERCEDCSKEYIRDFEMKTVGFKCTRRRCDSCGGRLRDNILDWEDPLPEDELKASIQHTQDSDLVVCFGTSLQITPACNIPERVFRNKGRLVIVNLQRTPKDKRASLVIHAKCDEVMSIVLQRMQITIPPFIQREKACISYQILRASEAFCRGKNGNIIGSGLRVFVSSVHGMKCPLPYLKEVEVNLVGGPCLQLHAKSSPLMATFKRPLYEEEELSLIFRLYFMDSLNAPYTSFMYRIKCTADANLLRVPQVGRHVFEFQSQVCNFPQHEMTALEADTKRVKRIRESTIE